MSGMGGSYFNTRGSGVVAKLGTDGHVFTSTGAGLSQGFESAAGGGKILQVQTTVVTGRTGITSQSWTDAGMSVNITPSASSSTVLIQCYFPSFLASHNEHQYTFYRDSTNIGDADNGFGTDGGYGAYRNFAFFHIDSPSSTSQITYAVYGKRLNSQGGTMYRGGPSDGADPKMNILAMEIDGS